MRRIMLKEAVAAPHVIVASGSPAVRSFWSVSSGRTCADVLSKSFPTVKALEHDEFSSQNEYFIPCVHCPQQTWGNGAHTHTSMRLWPVDVLEQRPSCPELAPN